MGRFSDIMRADELKADKDAYELWLKKSRAEKQTAYKATIDKTTNKRSNVGKELGYIFPFGIEQSKKILLLVNLVKAGTTPPDKAETETTLITKLTTVLFGDTKYAYVPPATGATLPAASSFIVDTRGKKIQPAKCKLVEVGASVEGVVSRFTGRPYSYRKKNSISSSFGQKIGTETNYEAARETIRKALETEDKYTVYFTPQGEIDIAVTAATP